MTVADRIREKRCELQWSQTELATRAHYSDKTAISKIENAGNNITMKQVNRIAEALGVSSAYLMGWGDVDYVDSFGNVIETTPTKSKQQEVEFYERMRAYYERYINASPEVQSAIDLLLETSQRKK